MPVQLCCTAQRLLLTLSVVCLLAAEPVLAGQAKTLIRFHDPLVVSTAALPGVEGRSTAEMALYRVRGNRLEEMPYQFDALDRSGDVEIDGRPEFTLDGNDELVFMAKDTGDQADATALGGAAGLEIEIDDPSDGGRGWAYLLPATTPAISASSSPYVYFDTEHQRASSDLYEVDYADGSNFLTGLRISPAAGGHGENLLRQTHMLGEPTFSLLFGDLRLSFTERNSLVRVDGIKNGWVRSVRRVHLSLDIGSLFPDLPGGTVYTFHYFSSFSTPTQLSIPWMALKMLRDFRFENVVEFAPTSGPQRYWDAANPRGMSLAANSNDEIETNLDHDWWTVSGTSGALLLAFLLPKEWTDWGITRGTVVQRAGASAEGPVHDTVGAGFTLRDMIKIKRPGSYRLMQSTVVLPRRYQPGDEDQVMAMFHAPLRVQVQPLDAAVPGRKLPVLSRAGD